MSESWFTAAFGTDGYPSAAEARSTASPGGPRSVDWLGADLRTEAAPFGTAVLPASCKRILAIALLLAGTSRLAVAQESDYQVDPEQSSVKFTLGDVLHTVRGLSR